MRKIISLFVLILSLFMLVGCGDKTPEAMDIDVSIADEMMTSSTLTLHVIVPIELASVNELNEIMYSVASQRYEHHFETIGMDRYTLTIYVYSSQSQVDAETNDYGMISFTINESMTNPGLSLDQNDLMIA